MMLPEHRECKRSMPGLEVNQQLIINPKISESLYRKSEITLTVFETIDDCHVTGYVMCVN